MPTARLTAIVTLAVAVAGARAQPTQSVEQLMARVGERLTEYYRRAQNVVCIEKSTIQEIGWNYSPEGFSRTIESELHVEDPGGDGSDEPKIVREVRRINGRTPRERDKKERAACMDPQPLSTEPLAFLLPAHRGEYRFTAAGGGKEGHREALLIDFSSTTTRSKLELKEDPQGRDGCYQFSGDLAVRGRVWIDAATYDVMRVDQHLIGPADMRVSDALQRRHVNLSNWVMIERYDTTMRYKIVPFTEPEETLLLPQSVNSTMVVRGGLASMRQSQNFSDYRRFLTGGRVVK
jgi:hypothetical protein